MHGVKGGLAAGVIFMVPGAVVMLALSLIYAFAVHLICIPDDSSGRRAPANELAPYAQPRCTNGHRATSWQFATETY